MMNQEPMGESTGQARGERMTQSRRTEPGHAGESPQVVAVIPAHNEERFIGSVVLKAQKYAVAVIVVDDGSTDATAEVARSAGARVIHHKENRGKGVALNSGLREAGRLDCDAIVVLDGDGQHQADEIPWILAPVLDNQADIVVGSRYLEKQGRVPRHRIWGHQAFTSMTNLLSGIHVTDSQSGFRAFSRTAVSALTFSSNGFSVESEMQFQAREHGLRLVEAPITAYYEDKPKRPVWAHGLMVLNGVMRIVGQYRPLLFFGLPGLVFLIGGLILGTWIIDIYSRTQQLAVGYAIVSIAMMIIGSVGLSTGIILHSVRGLLLDLLQSRLPQEHGDQP
jgi:glycosyltransferase involved in cell wall biosynthesis